MSYNDPKYGLIGAEKYARKTGEKLSKVEKELTSNRVYNLNKPIILKYPTKPVIVRDVDEQWQMDILDNQYYKKDNDGYNYLLTVIDIFSKYAWGIPLKTKGQKEVTEAIQSIFNQGRVPRKIQTDQGKEFFNQSAAALFKKYDINHFNTNSQFKASVIERFNRTMRNYMSRLYTMKGIGRWIDDIQDLFYNYNHTYHSTIKMTPVEASEVKNKDVVRANLQEKWDKVERGNVRFKIGDRVRLSVIPDRFARTDKTPRYTYEIFTVSKIFNTKPVTYAIRDEMGEELDSFCYNEELTKA